MQFCDTNVLLKMLIRIALIIANLCIREEGESES